LAYQSINKHDVAHSNNQLGWDMIGITCRPLSAQTEVVHIPLLHLSNSIVHHGF
jgi:hypothetical protein